MDLSPDRILSQRSKLSDISNVELEKIVRSTLEIQKIDRRENQLELYQPASPRAGDIHRSNARVIGVGGGNGSSKTETCLVEIIALATGVLPRSQRDYLKPKFRGPVNCRIIVESITTTLENVILPKLQWWKWTGVDQQGGERGHWGWIPKNCLKDGQWDKAWHAKLRTLSVLCRNPDDPNEILGESTIQFMCLRGDQRVLMADGTWREIKNVNEGDRVYVPETGGVFVSKKFKYENAPLLKIKCEGGREIISTPNHGHLMSDGMFKTADSISPGDVIEAHVPVMTGGTPVEKWKLGWTALMIGDGYIKGYQACLTAIPPSRVLDDLPPLPPNCKVTEARKDKEWRVTLDGPRRNNPLRMLLLDCGLWGRGSADKFVPEFVFKADIDGRAYFLKHLWHTDGTINVKGRQATYNTISRRLAYDVKYLLWSLGIYASICEYTATCGFTGKQQRAYHVNVSGGSFERVSAVLAGSDHRGIKAQTRNKLGKVTAVEPAGEGDVYCIEVDDWKHTFVCDGLVTHNSHEQDSTDFASGDFHHVMMDEPPRYAIWRENEARTMRVAGRLYLAMTWPDDPSIPVDWIFDEVYDKGVPGPNKVPDIDWFELWTTDNVNLNQEAIAKQMEQWDDATKQVRIFGRNLRFSHRIHPLFTDIATYWSYPAGKIVFPGKDLRCPETGSRDIVEFCHVRPMEISTTFPTVFLLDPHPRKPHMFMWAQIDGNDDINIVLDGELDDSPEMVRAFVFDVEDTYGMNVVDRMIDPNMGRSPASASKRGVTWQDEFAAVGLRCALADDSDVGRSRINEYLKPDPATLRPRIQFSEHAFRAIGQMKRYAWDNFRRADEKDLKQQPKNKHDDYPTLLKYLMNSNPTFSRYTHGAPVVRANRGYNGRTKVH